MPGFEFEFFTGQLDLHAFPVVIVHERGPGPARELNFCRQRAALQILITLQIKQWILAVRAIEFLRDMIHNHIVPILSAQAMVSIRRQHLNAVSLDAHDRNVECSATKVENENSLVFIQLIETIGHGCGRRLVDDLEDIEPGELTRGNGCGAFGVVEIGRHRDHGIRHRLFQVFLCIRLELAQNERRKLFRRIDLPVDLTVKLFLRLAHFALHEIDDPFRLGHAIVLGQGADDYALAIEEDDRGRDALALRIRDNLRLSIDVDVRDRAEGRAEINSNCFSSSHG